jgi:pimeloyl-ACP methyl ester carboxylesterase
MGATAAATAVAAGLPAGRLAMLAPMASVAAYAHRFVAALGAGPRVHRRLVARIEHRIGAPLALFEVPERGRTTATPPALIVHDTDDASIPVSDGAAVAAAWAGARLRVTSGLGHRRLLRDPGVVEEVVAFVCG